MSLEPAPITESVVDQNGRPTLPWTLFFNQNYIGDTGEAWTPTFTNLTTVGTPTITGRYYKISQELCFFHINIVPDTNTSATAGVTYCDNFPLAVTRNGFCVAVSGTLGGGTGIVSENNAGVYPPSWSAVTVPLTILGIVEAK